MSNNRFSSLARTLAALAASERYLQFNLTRRRCVYTCNYLLLVSYVIITNFLINEAMTTIYTLLLVYILFVFSFILLSYLFQKEKVNSSISRTRVIHAPTTVTLMTTKWNGRSEYRGEKE